MYWFTKDDDFARTCLKGISEDADIATNLKLIRDALSIDVEDGGIDFDNLSSIPDIWATHRIFDMMLYLPPNVRAADPVLEQYREAVIRQWRAVMTVMLIGQSVYHLKFEVREYSALEIKNKAADGTLAGRFLGAVIDARPKNYIWEDEDDVPFNRDIVRICCLRLGKTLLPIAVSSPTTYFIPAPDAWKHLFNKVPWIRRTIDPNGRTRYRVSERLMEELSYQEATALVSALGADMRAPVKVIDKMRPNAKIYEKLVSDFAGDQTLLNACDYFRHEALFIPELSYFSGAISTLNPDDTDPLLGGVDECCYYIDSTEYLEGTKTYYFYSQFFMPITALCRKLLASGELEYSINISAEQGLIREATVVLTRTSDGERIQMLYGEANPIRRIERLSDISAVTLWPRQKIDGWTSYFAFRYDEVLETSQQGDTVYARYSIEPDVLARSNYLVTSPRRGEAHRYYSMNTFPEYWTVEKTVGALAMHAGYLKTRVKNEVRKPDSGKTFFAAVDFGTTSTMLYGRVNRDTPAPISAKTLYAGAVCNPNRGDHDQSVSCFTPPRTELWDIALLHSLLHTAPQTPGAIPSVFYGIWIFFRSAATEKRAWPKMAMQLPRSNLKWDVVNPFDTQNYLAQVLYFIALEARINSCGSLQIYASYPGAMSAFRKKTYIAAVTETLESIASATGVITTPVQQITESFAVATEVVGGGLGLNFCSIDIGGGTSDIYLYYKCGDEENWRGLGSSLRIGARKIFHSEFWLNRSLLTEILRQQLSEQAVRLLIDQFEAQNPTGTGTLKITELRAANLNEEQMHSIIESLIDFSILKDGRFYNVANILKNIVVTSNDPHVLDFRLRIAFYIGAVCYYAGMLARERENVKSPAISNLTIQFAGNGSKIIDWISDKDENIAEFVKKMFAAGMKQKERPRAVQFSNIPKHEVARGALLSIDNSLPVQEQNMILAGEGYKQGGTFYSELSQMDDASPSSLKTFPEQEELKTFLTVFRDCVVNIVPYSTACRKFEYPEEDDLGFKNKVADTIKQLRSKNEELKPFFLVGVETIDNLSHKKEGIAR